MAKNESAPHSKLAALSRSPLLYPTWLAGAAELRGQKDRQLNRPPRLARLDRRVGPKGLVSTCKCVALRDSPTVEHQGVVACPILQCLVRSTGVVLVLHRRITPCGHRTRPEPRMFRMRRPRREVPCFEVHRPIHIDNVQPEKAIADRFDPGLLDRGARFRQKTVSGRQHPAEGCYDANPHVRDCRRAPQLLPARRFPYRTPYTNQSDRSPAHSAACRRRPLSLALHLRCCGGFSPDRWVREPDLPT